MTFFIRAERIKMRSIIGPPAKRHLNGVSLAGRYWLNTKCWLGSFVIFQGIWTSIAKKPHIFFISQGGGRGPDPLSPLWIRPYIFPYFLVGVLASHICSNYHAC